LNELDNHLNEVINNKSKNPLAKRSNANNIIPTIISCANDDCLADPTGLCLRCSKYYCYKHIQLCFQVHPNEIEIIKPMKNMTGMML
jgi:hypothetical protein